ncbi:VanZ like protein [Fontibacillus phaseoli]|uniref:VanZ like protein n=1 Tax=Fontibacillus phaseoli TaxID=1416533 RepID=A0A369BTG3_9BACL|nr:VanZ family protein [Fontibacillus phaseoli]RCX23866.1 VanZ like protein [Fontibacillus phaseoli]
MKKRNSNTIIPIVLLIAYTILLTYWMVWGFGRSTQADFMYNLKPLFTIKQFLHVDSSHSDAAMINLIGNIVVFTPFGVLLPMILKGRLSKSLLIFIAGLFILETVQLLSRRGSFDIDDFILNSLGYLIGFGVYKLFIRGARNV